MAERSPYHDLPLDYRVALAQQYLRDAPRRPVGRPRIGHPFDLFGQIPVTWEACTEWVSTVSPRNADSRATLNYIRGYSVPVKVARQAAGAHR